MASTIPPHHRNDFEIAVLCALSLEAECVYAVLDTIWKTEQYPSAPGDENAYTLGSIGGHNTVIVHMPGMGTDRSTSSMINLKSSFPNIRLALVVGICGGMPYNQNEEILLGDVVISRALIRYDFGRQYPHGFQRKTGVHDTLGPPSEKVLAHIAKMDTAQQRQIMRNNAADFLRAIQQKLPKTEHPGTENDILYHSSYVHQHHCPTCHVCGEGREACEVAIDLECEDLGCDSIARRAYLADASIAQPKVHFGIMGSGNTVMKSALHRDALSLQEGIIAVEMEGAGVWRHGPSVVVKGVCDYADSHKRKGWQNYAAATAAAYMKAFLLEWPLAKSPSFEVNEVGNSEFFLVPTRRVKKLFGREDEMARITSFFEDEADQPRTLILHAMGGQGKTQVALKYCYDSRHVYGGVFWINGSSVATTIQSLVTVAQKLDEPGAMMLPDDDARIKFVLRILGQWERRWLMVFDNFDDAATFIELREKFIPQVGRGDLLFTSRHRDIAELGEVLEIPPMPQKSGVALLLHRYPGIHSDDYLSEGACITDRLGNLALAIDQASAYLDYIQLPIGQLGTFLPQYEARRKKILQHTKRNFWNYIKTDDDGERHIAIGAFTTWEMSFEQLIHNYGNHKHVAHFLTLSAFLAPIPVSESLFRSHCQLHKSPPEWINVFTVKKPSREIAESINSGMKHHIASQDKALSSLCLSDYPERCWSADAFWDLLHQAFQMSLLQNISPMTESVGSTFQLHPLIRDWLQLRLTPNERQVYTHEAVNVITSSINTGNPRKSITQIEPSILQHMDAVLVCDKEFFEDNDRLGRTLATTEKARLFATVYREQGQCDASIDLWLVIRETEVRYLGNDHPDTVLSITGFASSLLLKGDFAEAERLNRHALDILDRVPDAEPMVKLLCMKNLTMVLACQDKLAEAEEIIRQVLAAAMELFDPENFELLKWLNILALMVEQQGRHSEAGWIYRYMQEILERLLETEAYQALRRRKNSDLAQMQGGQANYSNFEQIHRQALNMTDKTPSTGQLAAGSYKLCLAKVLEYQGKYTEAERLYRQALDAMNTSLGTEHPGALACLEGLASVACEQSRYAESEGLYRQILDIRKRYSGPENPETMDIMNDLGAVLIRQNKLVESESLLRQTLDTTRKQFGTGSPNIQSVIKNLTEVLERQGKYSESEQLLRQSLDSQREGMKTGKETTLWTMGALARAMFSQGKYEEAGNLMFEATELLLVSHGRRHPRVQDYLDLLRAFLRNSGWEKADIEEMVKQTLDEAENARKCQQLNDTA